MCKKINPNVPPAVPLAAAIHFAKTYVACPNRAKDINNIILNLVYDSFLPTNMLVLLLNTKKFSVYLKKMRPYQRGTKI